MMILKVLPIEFKPYNVNNSIKWISWKILSNDRTCILRWFNSLSGKNLLMRAYGLSSSVTFKIGTSSSTSSLPRRSSFSSVSSRVAKNVAFLFFVVEMSLSSIAWSLRESFGSDPPLCASRLVIKWSFKLKMFCLFNL